MTALSPIENMTGVKPVASEYYPSNLICAHPECSMPVDLRPNGEPTVHHIFPVSKTKGSRSYFVQINDKAKGEVWSGPIIPHAVGLCGSGTTGHHGDVEEHRAWIKYEDGEYIWYDRAEVGMTVSRDHSVKINHDWVEIGALNPQPGSREGKPKRKKNTTKQEKRNRVNWQVRVPQDEIEEGANTLDEYVEVTRGILMEMDAPGVSEDSPTYQIVVPLFHAGMVALDAENKARKKAAKEERARKRAEKAAS